MMMVRTRPNSEAGRDRRYGTDSDAVGEHFALQIRAYSCPRLIRWAILTSCSPHLAVASFGPLARSLSDEKVIECRRPAATSA
jgi:hypothetical protein